MATREQLKREHFERQRARRAAQQRQDEARSNPMRRPSDGPATVPPPTRAQGGSWHQDEVARAAEFNRENNASVLRTPTAEPAAVTPPPTSAPVADTTKEEPHTYLGLSDEYARASAAWGRGISEAAQIGRAAEYSGTSSSPSLRSDFARRATSGERVTQEDFDAAYGGAIAQPSGLSPSPGQEYSFSPNNSGGGLRRERSANIGRAQPAISRFEMDNIQRRARFEANRVRSDNQRQVQRMGLSPGRKASLLDSMPNPTAGDIASQMIQQRLAARSPDAAQQAQIGLREEARQANQTNDTSLREQDMGLRLGREEIAQRDMDSQRRLAGTLGRGSSSRSGSGGSGGSSGSINPASPASEFNGTPEEFAETYGAMVTSAMQNSGMEVPEGYDINADLQRFYATSTSTDRFDAEGNDLLAGYTNMDMGDMFVLSRALGGATSPLSNKNAPQSLKEMAQFINEGALNIRGRSFGGDIMTVGGDTFKIGDLEGTSGQLLQRLIQSRRENIVKHAATSGFEGMSPQERSFAEKEMKQRLAANVEQEVENAQASATDWRERRDADLNKPDVDKLEGDALVAAYQAAFPEARRSNERENPRGMRE